MGDREGVKGKSHLYYLVQVGVVVRDLHKTVEKLSSTFGIGPWRYFEWPPDREDVGGRYRGEPGNFRFRMAFVKLGHVELELVQPVSGKSIYSEFLQQKGEGLHHIRLDVPDVDKAVESWADEDIEVIQSGSGLRPGTRWAYLNTGELPGFGGINLEIATKFYEGDELPPAPEPVKCSALI